MRVRIVAANEVRIPEPVSGEAVVVERYGKPYAAVIDAETWELTQRLLALFGTHMPVELSLSEDELEAHRASERGDDGEEFDPALLLTHPVQ